MVGAPNSLRDVSSHKCGIVSHWAKLVPPCFIGRAIEFCWPTSCRNYREKNGVPDLPIPPGITV